MHAANRAEWTAIVASKSKADFGAFYREHRASVVRLALVVTGDGDMAADATQDAFIKVLGRWPRVGPMENPRGYLNKVVVRSALRLLKRQPIEAVIPDDAAIPPDATGLAVRESLRALKPEQRVILALSIGQGWSYAEIAEALGIPVGTVASRLHSAKEAFRREWGDER